MIDERLFPRRRPQAELRPRTGGASGAAFELRWFGTAGYVVSAGDARGTARLDRPSR